MFQYVENAWKVAEVIMIPKPGKDGCEVISYRPISLIPIITLTPIITNHLTESINPTQQLNSITPVWILKQGFYN